MVEHVNIPDSGRHEPRGASSAATGQILRANGDGTTSWVAPSTVVSPTDFQIETLINRFSEAGAQNPSGLDTAMQIEFGAALNGPSDPVQLFSGGEIQINEAGLYRLKFTAQLGRTGQTGVSILHLRSLANSGGFSTQLSRTVTSKLENADANVSYNTEDWFDLSSGTVITYELIRDSAGADSGGLLRFAPTPSGWGASPTASIRVERYIPN